MKLQLVYSPNHPAGLLHRPSGKQPNLAGGWVFKSTAVKELALSRRVCIVNLSGRCKLSTRVKRSNGQTESNVGLAVNPIAPNVNPSAAAHSHQTHFGKLRKFQNRLRHDI